jgi:hypothetical protein
VRIEDGAGGSCIKPGADRVWFTLRRLVTTQKKGWFKKDTSVAVIVKASVTSDPLPATGVLTFPLMANAKLDEVPKTTQVSVPIEYTVVSGLRLKQTDATYVGMGADVTLINKQDRAALGNALDALAAVTAAGKLPIPASPYLTGVSYLARFATDAIDKDIKANNDNQALAGSLSFNFDPKGECPEKSDFEKSGTKAFVFSEGDKAAPGYVDIARVDDYCWTADLTPAFVLKATPKAGNVDCKDPSYKAKFIDVGNNYTGFFLNKQTIGNEAGPAASREQDKLDAEKRCRANGIVSMARCPGAR